MALTASEEALVRQLLGQQAAILSLAGNEATITSKLGATKVTLADLVAASAVNDTDLLLIRQGTNDKSVSGSIIKALATQPDATETVKGIVELATTTEAAAGTDTVRAVTPAGVAAARDKDLRTVGASVAANALTVTLAPTKIDFRHATLNNGTVNTRSNAAQLSLTIPSTATLGTVSGISSRILILAIDNAGTMELAVYNAAGGANLDETGVINTTAIAGGSNSFTVYSQTARTGVPYRIVGFVDSTQATAGIWATAPSAVQGVGGQALAAMSSFGYGQVWQNVSASRAGETTYYNTTGKPLALGIFVIGNASSNALVTATVDGVAMEILATVATAYTTGTGFLIVPPGRSYNLAFSQVSSFKWFELR